MLRQHLPALSRARQDNTAPLIVMKFSTVVSPLPLPAAADNGRPRCEINLHLATFSRSQLVRRRHQLIDERSTRLDSAFRSEINIIRSKNAGVFMIPRVIVFLNKFEDIPSLDSSLCAQAMAHHVIRNTISAKCILMLPQCFLTGPEVNHTDCVLLRLRTRDSNSGSTLAGSGPSSLPAP